MLGNYSRTFQWLSILSLMLTAAACVSKPSITITAPDQNATSASASSPAPAVTQKSSPNFEGISGPTDADAPTQFTSTPSGLEYRILRKSDGRKPSSVNRVTVHYAGWLDNGTEFDSSYKRREPASFVLNEVVPGWTEGLQLIGENGMIELRVPSKLGYGAEGSPGAIPPHATIHFRVELLSIH